MAKPFIRSNAVVTQRELSQSEHLVLYPGVSQ